MSTKFILTMSEEYVNEAEMYIRNGYTITEDGRLFKDGREIK